MHQSVCGTYQIIVCGLTSGFKLHFETSGCTKSWNYRWSRKEHLALRIFFKFFLNSVHYLVYGSIISLFPLFQDYSELASSLACSYTWTGTCNVLYIFHCRVFHYEFDCSVGNLACTFECSSLRQFKFYCEISLILYRKEAGRNQSVEHVYEYQNHTETSHHAARILDYTFYIFHVLVITYTEPFVYPVEYSVFRFVRICRFQYQRTHHRT